MCGGSADSSGGSADSSGGSGDNPTGWNNEMEKVWNRVPESYKNNFGNDKQRWYNHMTEKNPWTSLPGQKQFKELQKGNSAPFKEWMEKMGM